MPIGCLSRRQLLAVMAAALATPGWARAPGLATTAPMIAPILANRVLDALFRHRALIRSSAMFAVADFSRPSSEPRLFLVDLVQGHTTAMLVAHGKGSDPDHEGRVRRFSDEIGSNATSEGAYLTGDRYDGIHGPSRRLTGLDPTNAHAAERAIVIHSAWYANADMISKQGRLGRSDGCFAVGEVNIAMLLDRLGSGLLLYAGSTDHV